MESGRKIKVVEWKMMNANRLYSRSFSTRQFVNQINFHLYHYAGNNPVKYTDPNGCWSENDDGSYTAENGDTLWELQQKTGRSWKETDYEGTPESLQIGQKVRYLSEKEINIRNGAEFTNELGDLSGIGAGLFKGLAKKTEYTTATPSQASLSVINPNTSTYASTEILLNKAGKILFGISIGFNIIEGIYKGKQTQSVTHGVYTAITGVLVTTFSAKIASVVGGGITMSTGCNPVIGAISGGAAGAGSAFLLTLVANKVEKKIWK